MHNTNKYILEWLKISSIQPLSFYEASLILKGFLLVYPLRMMKILPITMNYEMVDTVSLSQSDGRFLFCIGHVIWTWVKGKLFQNCPPLPLILAKRSEVWLCKFCTSNINTVTKSVHRMLRVLLLLLLLLLLRHVFTSSQSDTNSC